MEQTPGNAPLGTSAQIVAAGSDLRRTMFRIVRQLTLPDGAVSRQALFSGLALILLLNAISEKASGSLAQGFLPALFNTFDISLIIWGAAIAAIALLWRDAPARPGRADITVAALVGLAALVPVPTLSALALSGLAVWLYQSSDESLTRRAAAILLEACRDAARPVGVKISGGVRDVAAAATYLALADRACGPGWVSPATFRFGASGLLDRLLAALGEAPGPSQAGSY